MSEKIPRANIESHRSEVFLFGNWGFFFSANVFIGILRLILISTASLGIHVSGTVYVVQRAGKTNLHRKTIRAILDKQKWGKFDWRIFDWKFLVTNNFSPLGCSLHGYQISLFNMTNPMVPVRLSLAQRLVRTALMLPPQNLLPLSSS